MGLTVSSEEILVLSDSRPAHFKVQSFKTKIDPMLKVWEDEGSLLGLSQEMFMHLLQPTGCSEELSRSIFKTFDTDHNGKVDALEVLAVAIVLCDGHADEKMEAIFKLFDFSSASQLNFDEINILLSSMCLGLSKICSVRVPSDDDLIQASRQCFDCHNIPYEKHVTKDQLARWIKHDVEAATFVHNFQQASSPSQLLGLFLRKEQDQANIFKQVSKGQPSVDAHLLMVNERLWKSLAAKKQEICRDLLCLMAGLPPGSDPSQGLVSAARFVHVARAWNAFAALDARHAGSIMTVFLPTLVWLLSPQPDVEDYPKDPSDEDLKKLCGIFKVEGETISWLTWVTANVEPVEVPGEATTGAAAPASMTPPPEEPPASDPVKPDAAPTPTEDVPGPDPDPASVPALVPDPDPDPAAGTAADPQEPPAAAEPPVDTTG